MLSPLYQADYVRMQVGATGTGNGTAALCTGIQGGYTTLTVQVSGINGDTITWEGTIDGTNWISVLATPLTTGTAATTATANGLYRITVTGVGQVRARISTYGSGTVYVTGYLVA